MGDGLNVRGISEEDWEGIVRLESRAYAALGLSEDRAALESRADASPGTCFVLEREREVAGYLLALPYPRFGYPGLGRPEQSAFRSDNLHLHDLVVAEPWRGRGWAALLLDRLLAAAREGRYEHLSLVAVAGTGTFWSRHGFRPHPEAAPPEHYGAHAVYMSRPVGGTPHRPTTHHEGEPTTCRTPAASSV